jgi:hypothetical protein
MLPGVGMPMDVTPMPVLYVDPHSRVSLTSRPAARFMTPFARAVGYTSYRLNLCSGNVRYPAGAVLA